MRLENCEKYRLEKIKNYNVLIDSTKQKISQFGITSLQTEIKRQNHIMYLKF